MSTLRVKETPSLCRKMSSFTLSARMRLWVNSYTTPASVLVRRCTAKAPEPGRQPSSSAYRLPRMTAS